MLVVLHVGSAPTESVDIYGQCQSTTTNCDVKDDRDAAGPRQLPTSSLSLDSLSADGRYQVIMYLIAGWWFSLLQ